MIFVSSFESRAFPFICISVNNLLTKIVLRALFDSRAYFLYNKQVSYYKFDLPDRLIIEACERFNYDKYPRLYSYTSASICVALFDR